MIWEIVEIKKLLLPSYKLEWSHIYQGITQKKNI